MSASVPPQYAPTPDALNFGNGLFVLGSTGSFMDAVVTFSKAQPVTVTITVFMLFLVLYQATGKKSSHLPVFNPQPLSKKYNPANRLKLGAETKDNLIAGRKKYGPDQMFTVNGLAGELIVVPARFINEIRNDKDLSPQDAKRTAVRWSALSQRLLCFCVTNETCIVACHHPGIRAFRRRLNDADAHCQQVHQ